MFMLNSEIKSKNDQAEMGDEEQHRKLAEKEKRRNEEIERMETLELVKSAYKEANKTVEEDEGQKKDDGLQEEMLRNEEGNMSAINLEEGGSNSTSDETQHSGEDLIEDETQSATVSSKGLEVSPNLSNGSQLSEVARRRIRWGDINWDATDHIHRYKAYEEESDLPSPSGKKIGSPISSTLRKKLQKKSACYDDDMVYWESDVELHVHKSGMCFDNKNKIYFKPIDYKKGDLRPLYYRESSGDFMLAVTGVPGQSNKRLLKLKDWNRDAIYNVKSSDYKPGLINLFKDSFARIVRGEEQPVVLTPSSDM